MPGRSIRRMNLERRSQFLFLKEIHERRIKEVMRGRRNQYQGKFLGERGIGDPVLTGRDVSRQRIKILEAFGIEFALA